MATPFQRLLLASTARFTRSTNTNANNAISSHSAPGSKSSVLKSKSTALKSKSSVLKSKSTVLKIDLSDVPNQPLIFKHQVDLYRDNTRQRPVNAKTASSYMGVYWERSRKQWRAQIMVNKRVRNLGVYQDEEAAAQVYAKAAYKYKQSKALTGEYGGLDLSNVPEQPLVERIILKPGRANVANYKGIKLCRGKWQARISMNGKLRHLGTFDTDEEAANIYAKAAFFIEQQIQLKIQQKSGK